MKFRGHGNGVAIAIASLALVVAGTGAAVAATSTVTISDPTTPSRIAHVDASGRLATIGPSAPIISAGLASVTSGDNFITSPTTATLAVSSLILSNPSINSTASYAEVRYYFYKVGVTSSGTCASASGTLLGIFNIAPGDDFEANFPTPILVQPTGSAKYCLDLYATSLNGTYSASYYPSYNLAAYVRSGTYTGLGVNAVNVTPKALIKREKTATSR